MIGRVTKAASLFIICSPAALRLPSPVWVAGEASRAFVHVATSILVLLIHWVLIVLVAVEARELLEVAGHLMACRAVTTPLAPMLARVDREEKRVVVERGSGPRVDRMAR